YLEITAPNYPTNLSYVFRSPGHPISHSTRTALIISSSGLTALEGLSGQMQDRANKAFIAFGAFQCVESGAPGIVVSAGSGTPVYVAGKAPSPKATATDTSGQGGIFNVTPGAITLTSTLMGRKYGTQSVVT